MDNLI